MITLSHPIESPSGNRFHKKHWSVFSKWKKQCCAWAIMLHRAYRHHRAIGKRHVIFTSYRKRELDDDNLITGLKALRDALVAAGYLVDDAPRWATFEYRQVITSDTPRTLIEIEEEQASAWPAHIGQLLKAKP